MRSVEGIERVSFDSLALAQVAAFLKHTCIEQPTPQFAPALHDIWVNILEPFFAYDPPFFLVRPQNSDTNICSATTVAQS